MKKEVIIPNSVTNIGENVFFECPSLSSINIPQNLTNVGKPAFSGCTSLETVEIDSDTIASGLTSLNVYGNLIGNATTIYIKSGLTVGSYVTNTTNFTETTSDKEGYVKYIKN